MEPRISIITLGVTDLARAIAFYQDGLGLERSENGDDIGFFKLRGIWLALYDRAELAKDANFTDLSPTISGFPGFTLAYNVETKTEVDALLQRASEVGGQIVKAGEKAFWGGYSGYFTDPDGYVWEVATNPNKL